MEYFGWSFRISIAFSFFREFLPLLVIYPIVDFMRRETACIEQEPIDLIYLQFFFFIGFSTLRLKIDFIFWYFLKICSSSRLTNQNFCCVLFSIITVYPKMVSYFLHAFPISFLEEFSFIGFQCSNLNVLFNPES